MKTIKLSALTAQLLPALRTLHNDDDAAVTAALNDHIKTYKLSVTDEKGQPLTDTEFVVVGQTVTKAGEEAITTTDNTVEIDKLLGLVKKSVKDALEEQTKSINKAAQAIVTGGDARNDDTRKHGFKTFHEFVKAVREGSSGPGHQPKVDERLLVKAPTTYASEGAGGDGGFLIPPDFRDDLVRAVFDEPDILARTNQISTNRNSVQMIVDETTPWGTGGVRVYWLAEAAQKTQSKPSLTKTTVELDKIAGLVPVTDELMEDAPMIETLVRDRLGEQLAFNASLAIVQGSGVGQPLGILNSPALVSVAKEGSQAADTIVGLNVVKMWSRLYAQWRRNAVWLSNQDIEPQLRLLMKVGKLDTGANDTGWGIGPLFYEDNNGNPTLMGRPVIYTQATETLGDKGDLILADLSQYMTLKKAAGAIKYDVSIHLWFDYDVTAIRAVMRIGGQPWLSAPIAARDGAATYSAFVTLDERA